MVLRIHFRADDLERVRVAPAPDPLWELVLSLNKLQSPHPPVHYRPWRTQALRRIRRPEVAESLELLRTLVPPRGNFPDFLTPGHASVDLEAAYESILRLPRQAMLDDLGRAFRRRHAPGWVGDLADARGQGSKRIVAAMRIYRSEVLRPVSSRIDKQVETDLATRAHQLADSGPVGLLRSLPAPIRWAEGVLEADYLVDKDVHLNGRGLTLVPSYFCWGTPVTLIDPELPPTLVYPARPLVPEPGERDYLAGLLGSTRARILRTLDVPLSTSELARLVHVSAPAVSQHIGVLRGAGLVTSERYGPSVLHVITRLGLDLLDQ